MYKCVVYYLKVAVCIRTVVYYLKVAVCIRTVVTVLVEDVKAIVSQ